MKKECIANAAAFLLAMFMPVCAQEAGSDSWESLYNIDFQLILESDRGDSMRVAELIDMGAEVNTTTYDGVTPLMYASQNGHLSIVKKLIAVGAEINTRSPDGYTALIVAVRSGWIKTAEYLIRRGADINLADRKMVTPLMYAVATNQFYMVDMLLYYGSDFDLGDQNGVTALMAACRQGLDIALLLIGNGADVNAEDEQGRTALHFSVMNGNADIMDVLIESGAHIEKKTYSGYSPLSVAAALNDFEAARLLIGYGADVNSRISLAQNPLSLAEKHENQFLTNMLKKNGAVSNYWPNFSHFTTGMELSFSKDNTDLRFQFGISDNKYNIHAILGYGFWVKSMQVLEQVDADVFYQYWEKRSSVSLTFNKDIFNLQPGTKTKLGMFTGIRGIYSFGRHTGSDTKAADCWSLCPGIGIRGAYGSVSLTLQYEYMNLDISGFSNNRINFSVDFLLSRKKGNLITEWDSWL